MHVGDYIHRHGKQLVEKLLRQQSWRLSPILLRSVIVHGKKGSCVTLRESSLLTRHQQACYLSSVTSYLETSIVMIMRSYL